MAVYYESYYGVLPSRSDYIEHHGIKGQKWYHRRFQNSDGSLTPAGRSRYGIGPARKFKTKEERAAAKAEKQEQKRTKFSGKMQEKYNLIDVPTNKDAAWDNAHDMLSGGASDRELKKYLKLNGLDKKSTSDLMKESKAQKEAKRDEERKAKRQADLDDAVSKGDASRIMKYANEMSTNDLNNALNRVRYMTALKDLGAPPKKDSVLKKIASIGNDIANAGNAVANASAAVKKVSELFKEPESEVDKSKTAAYREALKNSAAADATEMRNIAKEAGLPANVAEKIVKDRYEQLYNGKKAGKEYSDLMKIGENLKKIEAAKNDNSDNANNGGGKKKNKNKGGDGNGDANESNKSNSAPQESAFEKWRAQRAEARKAKDAAEADMIDRLIPMGLVERSKGPSAYETIMANRKAASDAKNQSRSALENAMRKVVSSSKSDSRAALEKAMAKTVSDSMASYPSRAKTGPINVYAIRRNNEAKVASLNREVSAYNVISKRASEFAARQSLETKLSDIVKSSASSYPSRTTSPIDLSAIKRNNQTKLSELNSDLPDWLKRK